MNIGFRSSKVAFQFMDEVLFSRSIVTLFLIRGFSLQNMLMILYGGIITPVFEELLFRGTLWNKLRHYINKELLSGDSGTWSIECIWIISLRKESSI